MRNMLYIIWGSLCLLLVISGCKSTDGAKAPVSLTWKMGAVEVQPGYYENSFVLKNISDVPLEKDWIIYYSQLPREILQEESAPVKVEVVNANFFRMYPAENFQPLAPGDSLTVKFCCTNGLKKMSHAPEGTYWVSQSGSKQGIPLPVGLTIQPLKGMETEDWYPAPDKIYASNLALETTAQLQQTDIFPSVKEAVPATGKEGFAIENKVKLTFHPDFANEAELLKEKLATIHGLEVVSEAPVTVHLDYLPERETAVNGEYYRIDTGNGLINISASTSHGIFNGTQTLLSLLKGQEKLFRLEALSIRDYPDLPYRGQMLDIARNFTTVEHLKKLVDVISSYKLNVLHFHFSDDEGWRLEIPGLEELTSVGARRGHTTDELECLYPGYDGNYDPSAATSGNGYYTREEFIDLLRYAAQRHVRVIPEIESPGHARAAIVSMKARYHKYVNTAPEKANEYLLSDAQDTSRYVSAQSYTDNVMNVALPSTYRFMEKVIRELIAMYEEAEVPLTTIHLGGDEVPEGAWMGSPVCRTFMDENGMTSAHELSEYYITKMADYLQQHNLQFSGWQEVALGHPETTDRHLNQLAAGVYCWNTVPEWEADEIPYQRANKGYPVILCNV
ncbi:family 20 glycosylhydrolase, partial [Bacteroides ovatus]